jgi:hypothetical protein
VVPAGATVRGVVTEVQRSGRVKGLARLAFRFSVLEHPTTGSRVGIRTATIIREAKATKKKEAASSRRGSRSRSWCAFRPTDQNTERRGPGERPNPV